MQIDKQNHIVHDHVVIYQMTNLKSYCWESQMKKT
nr:MAG TPA: hypothetical protein [Caudoviricetes sp.]